MRSIHAVSPVLLLWLLVGPGAASGQITLGASGGAVVATAEGDDVPDGLESRTSFNVGVFADVPLTDMFSLTPGIYYVQKGARDTSDDLETKLHYVEIPLLLSVGLFESGTYGFGVFAGPSLAFEVQCFQEATVVSDGVQRTGDVECDDLDPAFETKSLDVGAMFGAALTFYLTRSLSAVAHGGLDLGLSSIDDGAADRDLKNSAWFLNAGLAWAPRR